MKTQDIRNMALAFQAVTEKKSVTEATVSSGQVLHDLEHKDEPAHAVEMKKKHGVKTTFHGEGELKYHGSKPQVKKALVHLYGKYHRHVASAKSAVEEEHPHLYEEAVYTEKKLAGDQHELDHDKDGDIDAADFKGLRNKGKKDKKSEVEVKPTQKMNTDKSQEETLDYNPAKGEYNQKPGKEVGKRVGTREDTELESLETQIEETYVGVQSGMRQAMMQMWEKASHKANQPGEEIDSKDSVTAKKMRADHKPEVNDTEEKGHNDAAAAGRVGPKAAARNGDNMKGDKAIINPVKGTT